MISEEQIKDVCRRTLLRLFAAGGESSETVTELVAYTDTEKVIVGPPEGDEPPAMIIISIPCLIEWLSVGAGVTGIPLAV